MLQKKKNPKISKKGRIPARDRQNYLAFHIWKPIALLSKRQKQLCYFQGVSKNCVCTHQQKDHSYMKSAGVDGINFQQIKNQCKDLQLIIISREDGTEGVIESGRSMA